MEAKDTEEKRKEEKGGEEEHKETLTKSLSDFCSKLGLAVNDDDKKALFDVLGSFKCEERFFEKACQELEQKRLKDDEEFREDRIGRLRTDVKASLNELAGEFADMEVDEILQEEVNRVDTYKYELCAPLIHYEKIKITSKSTSMPNGSSRENGTAQDSLKKAGKAPSLGDATSNINGLEVSQAKDHISPPAKCGLCEASLSSVDDFVSHVGDKHKELSRLFIPPPCPIPRCSKCYTGFDEWNTLLQHLSDGCNGKPQQASMLEIAKQLKTCDCCKEEHDDVDKAEGCCNGKRQNIRCHLCLTSFPSEQKKMFQIHMKTFHSKVDKRNSVIYPCPFCKNTHDKIRPFVEHLADKHYNPGVLRKRRSTPSLSKSSTNDLKRKEAKRPKSDPNLPKPILPIRLPNNERHNLADYQVITEGEKRFVVTTQMPPPVKTYPPRKGTSNSNDGSQIQNGAAGISFSPRGSSQIPLPAIVKPEPAESDLNGNEELEPDMNGNEDAADTIIGF